MIIFHFEISTELHKANILKKQNTKKQDCLLQKLYLKTFSYKMNENSQSVCEKSSFSFPNLSHFTQ